jgi:hypothetical protein
MNPSNRAGVKKSDDLEQARAPRAAPGSMIHFTANRAEVGKEHTSHESRSQTESA